MANKISLLFVLHNHQPCDNFGWVFEEAYEKAYEPFIGMLEKYPRVRVTMHYSGSLMEWLVANKPEFVARIKELLRTRRIELLTGGFYEPILPIIPDADKVGQVAMSTEFIKNRFEFVPGGAWVPERVWDGSLSGIFKSQGAQYAIIDENHIKQAGAPAGVAAPYYELPDGFKVFAINKKIRYVIPFAGIPDVLEFFKGLSAGADDACVVFADDGEKFGYWPHTYDWVYRRKWIEQFFRFLSGDGAFVETITFKDAMERFKPAAIGEIPSASYSEMTEWSRGDFRNFFKLYPEANIMRNRMLTVSRAVNELSSRSALTSRHRDMLDEARTELYKAQSGCAYWHGVFGGLYMNHLRSGVYRHLIKAQGIVERMKSPEGFSVREADLDDDLNNEIVLANRFIGLYVKPGSGGTIFGLDNKEAHANLLNTVTRRKEPYHDKILKGKRVRLRDVKKNIQDDKHVDIYDILGFRGKRLKKYLVYDEADKVSLVDFFIQGRMSVKDFARGRSKNVVRLAKYPYKTVRIENSDSVSLLFEKEEDVMLDNRYHTVSIRKEIALTDKPAFTVSYSIRNMGKDNLRSVFATEFNWSLKNRRFMKNRELRNIDRLELKDEWTGALVRHTFSGRVNAWAAPVYTVNESEGGLDWHYQHLSVVFQRPVNLDPGHAAGFDMEITIGK